MATAMQKMAAYFRLTFNAEYKYRGGDACKDFIRPLKPKDAKEMQEQWWIDHFKKCKSDSHFLRIKLNHF